MKNILFVFLCTFSVASDVSSKNPLYHYQEPREYQVKGYFNYQGSFKEVWLTIAIYPSREYGSIKRAVSYTLGRDVYIHGISNSGGCNSDIYTLNPNNRLAIDYNFTHYVDTQLGKVYLRQ